MKLWKDRDTLTPVYWFKCEPGARNFGLRTSFGSHKTWCRELKEDGLCGERLAYYSYYKGQNPVGYEGKRHCGTDLAMQFGGVTGKDKDMMTDGNGSLPCCFVSSPPPPPPSVCVLWAGGSAPASPPLSGVFTMPSAGWVDVMSLAAFTPWFDPNDGPPHDSFPFETPCYWVYLTPEHKLSDFPGGSSWAQFGFGFRAQVPGLPPNCSTGGCAPLLVFIKRWQDIPAFGGRVNIQREYSGLVEVIALTTSPWQLAATLTQTSAPLWPPGTLVTFQAGP